MTPVCRRTLLGVVPALLAAPARAGTPRVVSLDFGLTETLLALGAAPVGMPGPAQYRQWVIEPVLPAVRLVPADRPASKPHRIPSARASRFSG